MQIIEPALEYGDEDESHNIDESAARKAVYNEIRHAAFLR
jgi:hypothetical protein